jgi:hypothetical protein
MVKRCCARARPAPAISDKNGDLQDLTPVLPREPGLQLPLQWRDNTIGEEHGMQS